MPDNTNNQFQHYVPRFYLCGWQTTVGHKPKRVWVYGRDNAAYHAAIKKVGGSDNFYAIENNDGATDIETVEKILAANESKAGQIIPKIKNGDALNQYERRYFSQFLSVLSRRTPFAKAQTKAMIPGMLPNIIDRLLERANSIQDEERRQLAVQNVNTAAANAVSRAGTIASSVLLQPFRISPVIEKMDWAFFHSPNVSFVASDNPFVYSIGLGIGNYNNGHIIFPVTKHISFQARNSTSFNSGHYNINEDDARSINLRIIRHAYRQVYSSEHSSELEQIIEENLGKDLDHGEGVAND